MKKTYELQVAGLSRKLPIIQISDSLAIASFVILGDTELVCASAKVLAERLPKVDVLVTAEAKGIPLVFEVSKILGMKNYIVARKSIKAYMDKPLVNEVESITTNEKQMLCLDGNDLVLVQGKRVAIIDDVISTGESLRAVEELVKKAGGQIVVKAAILAEGDAAERKDILFLEKLPLFPIK
jgi:adenine phosphoribosyltransferase